MNVEIFGLVYKNKETHKLRVQIVAVEGGLTYAQARREAKYDENTEIFLVTKKLSQS